MVQVRHKMRLTVFAVMIVFGLALSTKPPSIARIRASRTTIQTVKDINASLHDYMQLPASQYSCVPMPLNSSLDRIYGTSDQFRLRVPPMKLKSPGVPEVEVRPLMMAGVKVFPDQVLITSDSCEIRGSKIIDDLKINDFFEFKVKICLTWETSTETITAQSEIEVDLDPPGVFAFVPRRILEVVGNRAVGFSLGTLQKKFMKSLASDFERWSIDKDYREQRKLLEKDMQAELPPSKATDDETLMAYLKR
jgi:hypothetical protein